MYVELKNYDMMENAIKRLCDFLQNNNVSEESIFNSRLVTSELVSNVFQHSDGTAFLSWDITDEKINIRVKSTSYYRPPEKSCCSDVYAEGGRGLYIVDCVSEKRTFSNGGEICVTLKTVYR